MAGKGKLNWVKKHIAITTLQKRIFDKLRKYEKRFGSDVFGDMLVIYMEDKSAFVDGLGDNGENFYQNLVDEYDRKIKES